MRGAPATGRHRCRGWAGTGETIPLLARVLGASDFLDALTSPRAYRPPTPVDEVVAMIRRGAGTHFDPAIADVVGRLHARGELLPDDWDG